MASETRVVTGSFLTRRDAQHAVHRLVAAGCPRDGLSLLTSTEPPPRSDALVDAAQLAPPSASRVAESACAGGTIGGALGAVLAGAAAIGSIAIPEVGVVLAGPLVAALAGAGAGGAAGGLGGALVGVGLGAAERDPARRELTTEKRVVVAVETTRERAATVVAILRAEGSRVIEVG